MRCSFIWAGVVAAALGLFWALRPVSTGSGTAVEAVLGVPNDSPSGRSTATVPDGRAGRTPLPPPLTGVAERVLRERSWCPKPREVPLLDAQEEQALIEAYQITSSLTNRHGIMLALAYGGSEAVVPLLVHTLTDEFAGKLLTGIESDAYLALPRVMGYVARRHAAAFEFLVAACEPAFWEQRPLPQFTGNHLVPDELIGGALHGLALSGRPEAHQLLMEIRNRSPEGWPAAYRSEVVDAAFHLRMVQQHGDRYLNGETFPRGEQIMAAFIEWGATPEGAEWRAWSDPDTLPRIRRRGTN